VPSTGRLKAFKLLTTSNAYWKGDAQNQRCSGCTAPPSSGNRPEGAPAPPRGGEEARSPAARRELGLFTFHPWAPGAAFWLAKGTTLYNLLADYMRQVLFPPATSS